VYIALPLRFGHFAAWGRWPLESYRVEVDVSRLRSHISRLNGRIVDEAEVREWLLKQGLKTLGRGGWLADASKLERLPREPVLRCEAWVDGPPADGTPSA